MTSTTFGTVEERAELTAEATRFQRQRDEWNALLPSLQAHHLHHWAAIHGGAVIAVASDLLEMGEKVTSAGFGLDDVFVDYVRDGSESYIL